MAKIYSKAHRVIICLGEDAEDIKVSLEKISLATDREYTKRLKKEINDETFLNLLRRPWFQRIWVRE
jgi:hypothetical protein